MAKADIVAGTITLTTGSATFTGTDTFWQFADIREGDTIIDVTGATEFMGVIEAITDNTSGTLTKPWEGPTLTAEYRIRYMADGQRQTAQARNLIELLGNGRLTAIASAPETVGVIEMLPGGAARLVPLTDLVSGANYDVQVANMAARAAYDGQTAGFAVLVADTGDGRAAIFSKLSNASGDWSAAAYVTGPVGPPADVTVGATVTGAPGTPALVTPTPTPDGVELEFTIPAGEGFTFVPGGYNPATAFNKGDVVRDNNSAWIALQATTGNAPPVFPATSNAYWELLAAKGADGTGTGDMVGPASASDGAFVGFDGTTGKLAKELSNTAATSMLNTFATALKGLVPAPTAPEVAAGKVLAADGTWIDPPSGGTFTEKLINGRLLVNQRRTTSGSLIAGAVGYVGDLWVISNATNATLTWSVASSQSYGRNREENALTISFASAPTSGDVYIQCRAEGVNIVAGTVTTRVDVLNVGLLAAAPLSALFIQNFGSGGSANVTVSAVTPPGNGGRSSACSRYIA